MTAINDSSTMKLAYFLILTLLAGFCYSAEHQVEDGFSESAFSFMDIIMGSRGVIPFSIIASIMILGIHTTVDYFIARDPEILKVKEILRNMEKSTYRYPILFNSACKYSGNKQSSFCGNIYITLKNYVNRWLHKLSEISGRSSSQTSSKKNLRTLNNHSRSTRSWSRSFHNSRKKLKRYPSYHRN